jgi:uncharacterized protein (DUF362 family)
MFSKRLSRRAFLRLVILAEIGIAGAAIHRVSRPLGIVNLARWLLRGRKERMLGPPAVVGLGEVASYEDDVLGCLRQLWQEAEMPDVAGKRVLVKPNLVDYIEDHPATTGPAVVGAILDLLAELGAGEVVVGDGPCFRREAWSVVEACGLASVLSARGIRLVDLNYDDPRPVPARDGWFIGVPRLWLPRHVRQADLIISVPKLKTHHWTTVSLGLKNLLGVVPGVRYGWPKNILHMNGIPLSILGLYQTVRPVVTVVDGIVGMEGDGPLFGSPVEHGLLAVGRDPVAVDTACTRLMGLPVEKVDHLRLAGWAGIGQTEHIEERGVSGDLMRRDYQPAPSVGPEDEVVSLSAG